MSAHFTAYLFFLFYLIILIILLSCNREVPSRPSAEPPKGTEHQGLDRAAARPLHPVPCRCLHARQGQDTLRNQGAVRGSQQGWAFDKHPWEFLGKTIRSPHGLIRGHGPGTRPTHPTHTMAHLLCPSLLCFSNPVPRVGLLPTSVKREGVLPR